MGFWEETNLPGLLILIVILLFLFNPELLPRLGAWLGGQTRKPYRQARWMWSSFAGTEEESIEAEKAYGQECARAFAAQFPGKPLPTDQKLVSTIGARLAGAANDPRRAFGFTVLRSTYANAYALPGGFVFITGALLDLCARDQDEIAFFLGHEIGHVLKGHARDTLTASTFLNAVMARLPAAGQMLRQVLSKGYSQMHELEADQESLRLAAAAGFDGRASIKALQRLRQITPDQKGLAEYLSSHPSVSERVRELENSLR
jgi:predicted Zn-dependent protease